MPNYKVQMYVKPNGEVPVQAFLDSLDDKMRAKMVREIIILETNGPMLREPNSKPLGDGIFELRAQFASDITRVLYFFYVGKNIILTNGFIKKTTKTPKGEIDTAKKVSC